MVTVTQAVLCMNKIVPLKKNQVTKQDSQHQYTYSTYHLVGAAPDRAPLAFPSLSKHSHSLCTLPDLVMRGNSRQQAFCLLNAWGGLWQQRELLLSCSTVTTHCSRSGALTRERETRVSLHHLPSGPWAMLEQTQNRCLHPGKRAANGEYNRGL